MLVERVNNIGLSHSSFLSRGIVVYDRAGGAFLSNEEIDEPEGQKIESLEELSGATYTPLQMDALYMHEMFTTFMTAGFGEKQALRLTSYFFLEGGIGVSVLIDEDDDDDDDGIEWDEEED